jgi:hypothetical protein
MLEQPIDACDQLGAATVSVLLEVSEEVCRLGYGVPDLPREGSVTIRHAEGPSISFVIADKDLFIFPAPPGQYCSISMASER